MASISSGLLLLVATAAAREITFPSIAGYQAPLGNVLPNGFHTGFDVTTANFEGLTTFASLPYVHCLANNSGVEKYDIGILGAPFDTVRSISVILR